MFDFESDGPQFLAVDLAIRSRQDLTPLARAFEQSGAFTQFVARTKRHILVNAPAKTTVRKPSPERAVRAMLKLVRAFPPDAKRLWKRAKSRTFDLGFESGAFMTLVYEIPPGSGRWQSKGKPRTRSLVTSLSPEIMRAISSVGGTLATTIYPPRKMVRTKRRRARGRA